MFYQRMKAQQEELGKPAQAQKKPDLFTSEKHLQEELDKLDHEEEEVTLPMDEIVKSQKRLNSKFLLDKSGCDSLGDIKQLILRQENLYHFDDTPELSIDQLSSLEFLAISHNKLTDVNGISKLINLVELNISFNLVEDITPLNECVYLEKLYASNNKIRTLSGIRDLTKLKVLTLFKNKISDFEETINVLSLFKNLQELELEGNPCTRKFNYKYDFLSRLKVQELDGERIKDIDYELAKSFKADTQRFYSEEQEADKTNAPLKRPQTAPGRVTKKNFVDRILSDVSSMNQNLTDIPENENIEKMANLEQENESLRGKLNALEVELEETKGRENLLNMRVIQLENQMRILKVEAKDAEILLDNNQQLTKELNSLKAVLSNKTPQQNVIQENQLLQEELMELLRENSELKAKLENKNKGPNPKILMERKPPQVNTQANIPASKPEEKVGRSIRVKKAIAPTQKHGQVFKKPVKEESEKENFEDEIEQLLLRSSEQLSSLRSELREFVFPEDTH